MSATPLRLLVAAAIGEAPSDEILSVLDVSYAPAELDPARISRASIAIALTSGLFAGLLERVPTAAAYVRMIRARREPLCFDHGAMRTVAGATGALPSGCAAFTRILEPLGYRYAHPYPLAKLRMMGCSYTHADLPFSLPQFFLSELQVGQLGDEAQAAAQRVFGLSRDPLGDAENALLEALVRHGSCPRELALAGLPGLASAFEVNHPVPSLEDYETLRRDSSEAAWIATEGNRFNHGATRVPDIAALEAELRADAWPLKAELEVSRNGRVIQTAFIADRVMRPFRQADGSVVEREVPGSFYEFIERRIDPATGEIDLTFDTGNAAGIFAVTSGA